MVPQIASAIKLVTACLEAIRATPLGMPSGNLYSALMSKGCDINQYQKIEQLMLGTGLVRKSGDLLSWSGPAA